MHRRGLSTIILAIGFVACTQALGDFELGTAVVESPPLEEAGAPTDANSVPDVPIAIATVAPPMPTTAVLPMATPSYSSIE